MIIDTLTIIERFTAEKTQAWSIQRECKTESVFPGALALHSEGRGEHRQLIRERRQCGQHACPTHDQARRTLVYHPQANVGIQLCDLARAVHLGVDQGMCETEVVVAYV